MSRVKVSELRALDKQQDKTIRVEYSGLNIEIKKYLPFQEKLSLAASVYNLALKDSEIMLVDEDIKELAKVYLIVKEYTNISLPKDTLEAYDLLISTGLYDCIASQIPEEISRIEKMIDNIELYHENRYKKENATENIIKNGISKLLNFANEFGQNISEEEMSRLPSLVDEVFKKMNDNLNKFEGKNKEYAETITKIAMEDAFSGD